MVCCQVFGNETTITVAGEPGPFRAQRLQAGDRATPCCSRSGCSPTRRVSFTDNCVVGIRANEARIRELMKNSLMLVTALAPKIGYDNAAAIAKAAHANGTTLREEAIRLGYVSARGIRSPGATGEDDPSGLMAGRGAAARGDRIARR